MVCKIKVQQSRAEFNAGDLDALVLAEKDRFASSARGYFIFLLEAILRDIHLTADIVHGMACFDLHVLLSLPMDQVTFCFSALF